MAARPSATPLHASPATSRAQILLPGPTGIARSPEAARRAGEWAREDRVPSFALSGALGAAYDDLNHRLLLARERGEEVPCLGPGSELWTSDDPDDQELAADRCYDCPAMLLCKQYAELAKEPSGTWGGQTHRTKEEVREVAARKREARARAVNARREEARARRQAATRKVRPLSDNPRARRARERRATEGKRLLPPGIPRPCVCGCEGVTKGGWYLSGHDARHLSQLRIDIQAQTLTLDAALAEVAHSERLQAKFRKIIGA